MGIDNTYSLAIEYKNAITLLEKLLKGRKVNTKWIKDNQYIIEINGININNTIISRGYSEVSANLIGVPDDSYLILCQDTARQSRLGIWRQEQKFGSDSSSPIPTPSEIGVFEYIPLAYIIITILLFIWAFINVKRIWFFYLFSLLDVTFYFDSDIFSSNFISKCIIISGFIIVIFTILLIIYHNSEKNKKYFYQTFIGLIVVIIIIISIFAGLYYTISANAPKSSSELIYIYADETFENKPLIIKPVTDYLDIPIEQYNSIKNENTDIKAYNLRPIDCIYFSAVTYFTVGYGDMIPRGSIRLLALSEMIIGYVLQTFIFAMIVSTLDISQLFGISSRIRNTLKNLSGRKRSK